MGLANPGGGLVGAVVFLGTFHSSWDREACVWEAGPEDHVDFMSDNLPGKTETEHRSQCLGTTGGGLGRQQTAGWSRNTV